MKKSELKKIIREEIELLKEDSTQFDIHLKAAKKYAGELKKSLKRIGSYELTGRGYYLKFKFKDSKRDFEYIEKKVIPVIRKSTEEFLKAFGAKPHFDSLKINKNPYNDRFIISINIEQYMDSPMIKNPKPEEAVPVVSVLTKML